MINTINYIPNSIEIDKLKPYKKDEKIMESFSHIGIPSLKEEDVLDLDDNETFICESDLVLFSTSNNLEESYLQFHIYDKEEDDFVIHHDVFVYSPINDAEYILHNNDHYIALATFEKDVFLYDSCVFNPMTPQILLKGHSDVILTVQNISGTLFSGSEDKSVIKWDLESGNSKEVYNINLKTEKIASANNMIFCCAEENVTSLSGTSFSVPGPIENMIGVENSLYFSTSNGYFLNYDVRNLDKPIFNHKYSEVALTGMDILKGKIGICSVEGDITILDATDYEIKNTEKIKSHLYSIKLNENNLIFYGDETESLNMKKLRSNVF